MRNMLILTFILISVSCLGQIPTDWQLMNLKGKVKFIKCQTTMAFGVRILAGSDLATIVPLRYIEYSFDNNGYLLRELHYSIGQSSGNKLLDKDIMYCPITDHQTTTITFNNCVDRIEQRKDKIKEEDILVEIDKRDEYDNPISESYTDNGTKYNNYYQYEYYE